MLERMFDPENGFWTLMSKLYKVCALSLLWFVFSIPVFTLGAATAAFYDFTLHLVLGQEGSLLRSFWKSFVSNFKQATMVWLILLGTAGVLAVDGYICFHKLVPGAAAVFLLAMVVLILVLWILAYTFIFPVQAKYELRLSHLFRNSILLSVAYFPFTVLILFVTAIFVYLSFKFPVLSVFLMGIGRYVNSYIFNYIFEKRSKTG